MWFCRASASRRGICRCPLGGWCSYLSCVFSPRASLEVMALRLASAITARVAEALRSNLHIRALQMAAGPKAPPWKDVADYCSARSTARCELRRGNAGLRSFENPSTLLPRSGAHDSPGDWNPRLHTRAHALACAVSQGIVTACSIEAALNKSWRSCRSHESPGRESQIVKNRVSLVVLWWLVASVASAADSMRAVVFSGGAFQIHSVPKPQPQP